MKKHLASTLAASILASSAVGLLPARPAEAGSLPTQTRMASREADGTSVNGLVGLDVALSGNGRFLAFTTTAKVVAADTNGKRDVYVRDLWSATTELISVTDAENPVQGDSSRPSLSDDGRYVAFTSPAGNLVTGEDFPLNNGFVRDRFAGTTTQVGRGIGGALPDANVDAAELSGNGRFVVFQSAATNLVASDTNGTADVFVRDLQGPGIERVSVSSLEGQSGSTSANGSISDDGRFVAFSSEALLAGGVLGGETNVYVRDRTAGSTELINLKTNGTLPEHGGLSPLISGNGNAVAFVSSATDLVAGDTNGVNDVFVRSRASNTTSRVSIAANGSQIMGASLTVDLADDGAAVLFSSIGAATTPDAGSDYDLFVRDVGEQATRRITTGPASADPAGQIVSGAIDDQGDSVGFTMTPKLTTDASFDQAYVNGPVFHGPFGTVAEAVAQQYQDVLGRAPSPAEASAWSTRCNEGSSQVSALVAALIADPAFAATRAPLVRLYWAFFLRRPDASGLSYWLGRYQGGTSLNAIAQKFATSSEFKNRYGTVTNQGYVEKVYVNVFERQPDAGGLAYWTGKLNKKTITRGAVIVQFSESSEGKRLLAGPTDLTLVSLAMLRTVPTEELWNATYPALAAGERQAAWIAHQVLATQAYAARID